MPSPGVEGIVTALDLPQTELSLLAPQAFLDPGIVVTSVPGLTRLWMDAVDHHVDVLVLGIVVGDKQGLMLSKAEIAKRSVDHPLELRSIELLRGVEAEGQVVDGTLDRVALSSGGMHEAGDQVRIRGEEMPPSGPFHTLRLAAISSRQEVRHEPLEATPAGDPSDHVSLLMAVSISASTWARR